MSPPPTPAGAAATAARRSFAAMRHPGYRAHLTVGLAGSLLGVHASLAASAGVLLVLAVGLLWRWRGVRDNPAVA